MNPSDDGPMPTRRRARAGRAFVAPNLAGVAVFMVFPLGFSLYMSFQEWDLFTPARFVGLANFGHLLTADPLFVIALRNTVVYTACTLVPTVLISLVVAALLNRKLKGISILRTVVFLPLAVSSVVSGPSPVSSRKTASNSAGSVALAFSLIVWCAPGASLHVSPA